MNSIASSCSPKKRTASAAPLRMFARSRANPRTPQRLLLAGARFPADKAGPSGFSAARGCGRPVLEVGVTYADTAKNFAIIGGAVPACRPELSRSQASKSVPWFVKQFFGASGLLRTVPATLAMNKKARSNPSQRHMAATIETRRRTQVSEAPKK